MNDEKIDYNYIFNRYKNNKISLIKKEIEIINKADNAILDLLKKKNYKELYKVYNAYQKGILQFFSMLNCFEISFHYLFNAHVKNIENQKQFDDLINVFENYFDDFRFDSHIQDNILCLTNQSFRQSEVLHDYSHCNKRTKYHTITITYQNQNEYETIIYFDYIKDFTDQKCMEFFINKEYYSKADQSEWQPIFNAAFLEIENIKNKYDQCHKEIKQNIKHKEKKEDKEYEEDIELNIQYKFDQPVINILLQDSTVKKHYKSLRLIFKKIYNDNEKNYFSKICDDADFIVMIDEIKTQLNDKKYSDRTYYYYHYREDILNNKETCTGLEIFLLIINHIVSVHGIANIMEILNTEEAKDILKKANVLKKKQSDENEDYILNRKQPEKDYNFELEEFLRVHFLNWLEIIFDAQLQKMNIFYEHDIKEIMTALDYNNFEKDFEKKIEECDNNKKK